MKNRSLNENEERILKKLLSIPFPGQEELRIQSLNATARPTDDPDNYGSIYLILPQGHIRATSVGLRVPVEGLARDADREQVDILLHVVDGSLHELEFVRLDGKPLIETIDPETIQVIVNK